MLAEANTLHSDISYVLGADDWPRYPLVKHVPEGRPPTLEAYLAIRGLSASTKYPNEVGEWVYRHSRPETTLLLVTPRKASS